MWLRTLQGIWELYIQVGTQTSDFYLDRKKAGLASMYRVSWGLEGPTPNLREGGEKEVVYLQPVLRQFVLKDSVSAQKPFSS